jgi:hypothetical protein
VQLHPAVRVVASDWPVLGIWRRNSLPDAPKPEIRPETVLVTRPGFDPELTLLPAGAEAFLAALAQGETLGAAIESAGAAFDVGTTLPLLIGAGALAGLEETS